MISTWHQQIVATTPVVGLSPWLRTDLILAATLLFLVFASWAMLMSVHRPHVDPLVNEDRSTASAVHQPNRSRDGFRRGRVLGTFGIVLGLLGSFTLLVICAW